MAVVMRPYHDVVTPDLQRAYDELDRELTGHLQGVAERLRQFSQMSIAYKDKKGRHVLGFDSSRYAALQRTVLALASDLERAVANSGLAK